MLSPAAMLKLRLIVLERDVPQVTQALGELGVVHLRSSVQEGESRLAPGKLDEEIARCRGLMERLSNLMELFGFGQVGLAGGPRPGIALEQVEQLVGSLEEKAAGLSGELGKAQHALEGAEERLEELHPYRGFRSPLQPLAASPFLEVKAGLADPEEYELMRVIAFALDCPMPPLASAA